jgi:hypothetical protein
MIKIIENFLPNAIFNRIKGVVNSHHFKWGRYENIVGTSVQQPPYKTVDGFSNTVDIWNHKETGVFLPLMDCVAEEIGVSPVEIIRTYVNLTTPQYNWKPEDIAYPHVDDIAPHSVSLFYIDNADGDTILFDNFGPDMNQDFKIHTKIRPEPNKLVIFNGSRFHSGNPPLTSRKRIVVNMNFRKL